MSDDSRFSPGFFDSLKNLQMPKMSRSAPVELPPVVNPLVEEIKALRAEVRAAKGAGISSVDEDLATAGIILEMKEPKNKHAWHDPIAACIREYEKEFKRTPGKHELWTRLWDNPPKGHGIRESSKHTNCLQLGSGKPEARDVLSWENLSKKYDNLYPDK